VIALAREYFEESARAGQTGDTKRLRMLSTSDCPCLRFVRGIEEAHEAGRVEGFDYSSVQIKRVDVSTGIKVATVYADTPSYRFIPDSGAEQVFPARTDQQYIVSVQYMGHSLVIISVERVDA